MCQAAAGQYDAAEGTLLNAYAVLLQALGEGHEATRATRQRLRELYVVWGKPAEAAHYADGA
jgi:hypothetical protein